MSGAEVDILPSADTVEAPLAVALPSSAPPAGPRSIGRGMLYCSSESHRTSSKKPCSRTAAAPDVPRRVSTGTVSSDETRSAASCERCCAPLCGQLMLPLMHDCCICCSVSPRKGR